ncbi:MAG TPA: aminotransferase class V-fold PLP-dependent enzyme, partial [Clostridiaceae bacterium]|nr:aminotransferase class V-fold PLP-dependent enzyme [Clostridiaceae bacterium]
DIPDIHFYGDYQNYETDTVEASAKRGENYERMPLVTLNLRDLDASAVAQSLWRKAQICVRPGSHCAPLIHRHFGTQDQGMVRFSFSHFNTQEEVDCAIRTIHEINESK